MRVDDPALLPAARCLHSSSCIRQDECPTTETADLAWVTNEAGQFFLQMGNSMEAEPCTPAILYFLSEHRLTQLFAERLQNYLQLHTATVVDPSGRGWLICGPSRAGKTSLTLALILQGWHWLSDEYALISAEQPELVHGFPRNFNLKETSFPNFTETKDLPHSIEFYSTGRGLRIRFIDPLDLQANSWSRTVSLHGVLLPRWISNPTENRLEETAGIEAAQTLLGETANWQPWGMEVIAKLCRERPVYRYSYHNPRELKPLLETILS